MPRVFLGLGSNIEDRFAYLSQAYQQISKQYKIISTSSIYETEPIGEKNQSKFFNAVIEIETNETPQELFSFIKSVEKIIGRIERGKWQTREIDIDILLFSNLILETNELTIPHKEMHKRKFVLTPLDEIGSKIIHPKFNSTIFQLLSECNDKSEIQKTEFQLS